MIFWNLFATFFKIGLFGFGGGYAMLSMIQGEVVTKYGWITESEFTDIVAVSQMTPGPIGINSATYVGYRAVMNAGYGDALAVLGSTTATLSLVLPSFILMLTISRLFMAHSQNKTVGIVLDTMRPVIVGLVGAAALLMLNTENFGNPTSDTGTFQFVVSIVIFAVSFAASTVFKISPIKLIPIMGLAGLIIYSI